MTIGRLQFFGIRFRQHIRVYEIIWFGGGDHFSAVVYIVVTRRVPTICLRPFCSFVLFFDFGSCRSSLSVRAVVVLLSLVFYGATFCTLSLILLYVEATVRPVRRKCTQLLLSCVRVDRQFCDILHGSFCGVLRTEIKADLRVGALNSLCHSTRQRLTGDDRPTAVFGIRFRQHIRVYEIIWFRG